MNKLLQVAINDLRVTFRERGIWLNIILFPVFLIFLVGLANGAFDTGEATILIDVIDRDNSAESAQLVSNLQAVNGDIVLCMVGSGVVSAASDTADDDDPCELSGDPLDEERSQGRLEDGDIEAILEIPAGFGESVRTGQPSDIMYRSNDDPTQPSALLQSVQAAAGRAGGAVIAGEVGAEIYEASGEQFADRADRTAFEQAVSRQAEALWQSPPVTVSYHEGGESDSGGGGFKQSASGMGTMYVMFLVMGGIFILLVERKNWTLQRLVSMPVTKTQVIGGKVVARFVMGMMQYAVAFGAGFVLSQLTGADFGGNLLGIIMVMSAFSLAITALTLLLATAINTEMQAGSITTLVGLTLAPLGGAWWPLEIVPDAMRIIGHISPVAWAMDGFSELLFYNGGVADVLAPFFVLLAMAAVLFFFAVRRFKYE